MKFSTIYIRTTSKQTVPLIKRNFFDKVSRNWEQAWQQNVTPWDLKGTVCPPLIEAITNGRIQTQGKTALIPGCGSGYECIFLRQAGFREVVGLDLSETAVAAAKANCLQAKLDGLDFQAADFFNYQTNAPFNFIFDYLFFSAIDSPYRSHWAKSIDDNLSPDGVLATLVFPLKTDSDDPLAGPPYPVVVEDYEKVLNPLNIHIQAVDQVSNPLCYSNCLYKTLAVCKDIDSIKPRKGREVMVYWTKRS